MISFILTEPSIMAWRRPFLLGDRRDWPGCRPCNAADRCFVGQLAEDIRPALVARLAPRPHSLGTPCRCTVPVSAFGWIGSGIGLKEIIKRQTWSCQGSRREPDEASLLLKQVLSSAVRCLRNSKLQRPHRAIGGSDSQWGKKGSIISCVDRSKL